MAKNRLDIPAIEAAYIEFPHTRDGNQMVMLQEIADRYGTTVNTIKAYATKKGWVDQRRQRLANVAGIRGAVRQETAIATGQVAEAVTQSVLERLPALVAQATPQASAQHGTFLQEAYERGAKQDLAELDALDTAFVSLREERGADVTEGQLLAMTRGRAIIVAARERVCGKLGAGGNRQSRGGSINLYNVQGDMNVTGDEPPDDLSDQHKALFIGLKQLVGGINADNSRAELLPGDVTDEITVEGRLNTDDLFDMGEWMSEE